MPKGVGMGLGGYFMELAPGRVEAGATNLLAW